MLKFRCQHCGQRIAVPARHLGKLVTCAECGRQTHPLAQEFVRTREAATASPGGTAALAVAEPTRPAAAFEPCANCGQALGRLQASHLWETQRVCGPCYHVLSAESSVARRAGPVVAGPVVATRVRRAHASPVPVDAPASPGLGDQLLRGLVVFIVGVVALYGALTLLRDLAGLIAIAALAVLALLVLYGILRVKWPRRVAQPRSNPDAALAAVRGE